MRRLLLSVVVLGLLCAKSPVHPGTERWPIKTSVPDGANLDHAKTVSLDDLLALKDVANVAKNDKRYQDARIPEAAAANLKEGDIVTTTGWLHLVAGETDGDYHIQISGSADSGDHCLIVEVPSPDPEYVKTADLRPRFDQVRTLIKSKMLKDKDPAEGGSVMQHPVYVTVTGQLFYDDSHVGDQPRGKKGMKAATLWELHPVTAIVFAPKPK